MCFLPFVKPPHHPAPNLLKTKPSNLHVGHFRLWEAYGTRHLDVKDDGLQGHIKVGITELVACCTRSWQQTRTNPSEPT